MDLPKSVYEGYMKPGYYKKSLWVIWIDNDIWIRNWLCLVLPEEKINRNYNNIN